MESVFAFKFSGVIENKRLNRNVGSSRKRLWCPISCSSNASLSSEVIYKHATTLDMVFFIMNTCIYNWKIPWLSGAILSNIFPRRVISRNIVFPGFLLFGPTDLGLMK